MHTLSSPGGCCQNIGDEYNQISTTTAAPPPTTTRLERITYTF